MSPLSQYIKEKNDYSLLLLKTVKKTLFKGVYCSGVLQQGRKIELSYKQNTDKLRFTAKEKDKGQWMENDQEETTLEEFSLAQLSKILAEQTAEIRY